MKCEEKSNTGSRVVKRVWIERDKGMRMSLKV
jgi:hypothetical protein